MNTLESRIIPHVLVTPSGCWEWQGHRNPKGYGLTYHGGRTKGAHRAAYEIVHGPMPEGKEVDHLCRNRPCCNPAHLEAVTHAENNRRAGPYQSALKVDDATAEAIRETYRAGGISQRAVGRQFGVSATLVNFIVSGKRKTAA